MMRKLANSELERKTIEEYKNHQKTPLVIILDNVRSQFNIGSVFRTADAFLIEKIYLCGITATPPHREIQKSALGATESVEWEYFKNTLEAVRQLKEKEYLVYSLEQSEGSQQLHLFEPERQKTALVFGNEVKGVQQEVVNISDGCIEIPQFGTKHSFNIAVSAGIVTWDFYSKLGHPFFAR
jgi:tRNA G18 (ribose-2'-O)-methylase SpoU